MSPETYIDSRRRARAKAVRCLHDDMENVVLLWLASGQEGRDAVGAEVAEVDQASLGMSSSDQPAAAIAKAVTAAVPAAGSQVTIPLLGGAFGTTSMKLEPARHPISSNAPDFRVSRGGQLNTSFTSATPLAAVHRQGLSAWQRVLAEERERALARTGASGAGDAKREAVGGAGDELVRFDHQVAALKAGCRIDDERLERPVRVQNVDLGAWSSQPRAKYRSLLIAGLQTLLRNSAIILCYSIEGPAIAIA
jgi:hypothetical protein